MINIPETKMNAIPANGQESGPQQPVKGASDLEQAAASFESLFLNLVLQQMRKTVPKDGLVSGGNAEDIYRSMLDQEYSKMMSEQKMTGLSEQIIRQLTQNKSNKIALGKKDALNNYSMQMRICLLYTSPSPRDQRGSRMPSSA